MKFLSLVALEVDILMLFMTFSSQVALEVVALTTSGDGSYEKLVKMTMPFQWLYSLFLSTTFESTGTN